MLFRSKTLTLAKLSNGSALFVGNQDNTKLHIVHLSDDGLSVASTGELTIEAITGDDHSQFTLLGVQEDADKNGSDELLISIRVSQIGLLAWTPSATIDALNTPMTTSDPTQTLFVTLFLTSSSAQPIGAAYVGDIDAHNTTLHAALPRWHTGAHDTHVVIRSTADNRLTLVTAPRLAVDAYAPCYTTGHSLDELQAARPSNATSFVSSIGWFRSALPVTDATADQRITWLGEATGSGRAALYSPLSHIVHIIDVTQPDQTAMQRRNALVAAGLTLQSPALSSARIPTPISMRLVDSIHLDIPPTAILWNAEALTMAILLRDGTVQLYYYQEPRARVDALFATVLAENEARRAADSSSFTSVGTSTEASTYVRQSLMRGRVLPRDVSIAPLQLTDRTLLAESGVASARLSYDTSMLLVAATGRAALTYPLDVSNPIAAINQLAPNVSAPIDAHDVVMTSDSRLMLVSSAEELLIVIPEAASVSTPTNIIASFRIGNVSRLVARRIVDNIEQMFFIADNRVYIFEYSIEDRRATQLEALFGGVQSSWPIILRRRLTVSAVDSIRGAVLCANGDVLYVAGSSRLLVYVRDMDDGVLRLYSPAGARDDNNGVPAFRVSTSGASDLVVLSAGGSALRGIQSLALVGGGGETLLATTAYGVLALQSFCNVPLAPPATATPVGGFTSTNVLMESASDTVVAVDMSREHWFWPLVVGAGVALCCAVCVLCIAPLVMCCVVRRRRVVLSVDNRVLLERGGDDDGYGMLSLDDDSSDDDNNNANRTSARPQRQHVGLGSLQGRTQHSATGFWHRHVRHIEGGIGPRDKLGDKYWDNRGAASQSVAEDSDDEERRGSSIDGSVILRSHNTRSLGSFGSGAFTVSQLDPRALAERHAGVIKLFADTNDVAVAQSRGADSFKMIESLYLYEAAEARRLPPEQPASRSLTSSRGFEVVADKAIRSTGDTHRISDVAAATQRGSAMMRSSTVDRRFSANPNGVDTTIFINAQLRAVNRVLSAAWPRPPRWRDRKSVV